MQKSCLRCAVYCRHDCTKACTPYFQGAQRPILSAGRQGNCHSACRAGMECKAARLRNAVCRPDTHSEAAGASMASGGRRCAAPYALRRQASKYHSEAAGASMASDQAEVCGPVCPAAPSQQIPQRGRGREHGERPGGGVRTRMPCGAKPANTTARPPARAWRAAGRRCADTLACILSKKARAVSAARTFRYLIFFIIPGSASQRSMSQKLLHSTPAGARRVTLPRRR